MRHNNSDIDSVDLILLEKKDFFDKSDVTKVIDIAQSCILVSGIERTLLYRLM